MVLCLNLGKHELSFLFAKIIFGMDGKGQKPTCQQLRGLKKHLVNDNC